MDALKRSPASSASSTTIDSPPYRFNGRGYTDAAGLKHKYTASDTSLDTCRVTWVEDFYAKTPKKRGHQREPAGPAASQVSSPSSPHKEHQWSPAKASAGNLDVNSSAIDAVFHGWRHRAFRKRDAATMILLALFAVGVLLSSPSLQLCSTFQVDFEMLQHIPKLNIGSSCSWSYLLVKIAFLLLLGVVSAWLHYVQRGQQQQGDGSDQPSDKEDANSSGFSGLLQLAESISILCNLHVARLLVATLVTPSRSRYLSGVGLPAVLQTILLTLFFHCIVIFIFGIGRKKMIGIIWLDTLFHVGTIWALAPRGHPRGIAVFVAMELVNSIAISFVAHWSHSMDRRFFLDSYRTKAALEETQLALKWVASINLRSIPHALNRREEQNRRRDIEQADQRELSQRNNLNALIHEIRVPLHAVSLGIHTLQEQSHDEETNTQLYELMQGSDAVMNVLDNLLCCTKFKQSGVEIKKAPMNPWLELQKQVDAMRPLARSQHAKLVAECRNVSCKSPILGDASQLSKVIRNFISNALKFTSAGKSVTAWVDEVSPKRGITKGRFDTIRFGVTDEGPGIPKSKQKEIFHEFVQLSSGKPHMHSSGLGLAIAKSITEAHGGTIGITSRVKEGSTFYCDIPVERPSVDPHAKPREAIRFRFRTPVECLVVDDDHLTRKYTTRLLVSFGAKVVEADDGPSALETINRRSLVNQLTPRAVPIAGSTPLPETPPVDGASDEYPSIPKDEHERTFSGIVFLDYSMPGMTGPQTARNIRRQGFSDIIIGITGHQDAATKEEFFLAGADAVMVKPLNRSDFAEVLSTFPVVDGRLERIKNKKHKPAKST